MPTDCSIDRTPPRGGLPIHSDDNFPSRLLRVRVRCASMGNAGICPGDIVLVDPSRQPKSGDIVAVEVDGERLVRRFIQTARGVILIAEDGCRAPMRPREVLILGVVIAVVRRKT